MKNLKKISREYLRSVKGGVREGCPDLDHHFTFIFMHHKNNVKLQQEKFAITQKKLDALVRDGLLVGFNL